MADIKRGGFIGMIAAACAAPALASTKSVPSPRFILVYDVCVVDHLDAIRLGHYLGEMGLEGPMIGVDLRAHGEPIRLLNIDNIPPETVDRLIAKFTEIAAAVAPPLVSGYRYVSYAGVAPGNGNYCAAQAFWKDGNNNA